MSMEYAFYEPKIWHDGVKFTVGIDNSCSGVLKEALDVLHFYTAEEPPVDLSTSLCFRVSSVQAVSVAKTSATWLGIEVRKSYIDMGPLLIS